ncbi:MAG: oligosaccharide flippase family protein [Candidatus Peregrinibacteria bacterium]|nr:oligosaccharide flippase family protein [Candidatus Peregrinibacteria bacterium]
MKRFILSGGSLLGISALLSKGLSYVRDRLLTDIFDTDKVDLVFAAFRIPDFFFYLFVGATISVIFIPRLSDIKDNEDQKKFVSSFFWGVAVFFGTLSLAGSFLAEYLTQIFATGFDSELQTQIAELAKYLFGSVFLLSISGVFAAFLQSHHRFASIALAPIFYIGAICSALFVFQDQFGILIVGYAAIAGAGLHFLINFISFFLNKGRIGFFWKEPVSAFKNFKTDFFQRVLNNSAFQLNQTADVIIASFLLSGSVAAFSIGSNLGHILLSIVGFSVANSAFPKIAKSKSDPTKQKQIIINSLKWILFFTIPASIIGGLLSEQILELLFNFSEQQLYMTKTVFFWTVISLPFACTLPILSRVFLANDDSRTPLIINATSLTIATIIAATLSLRVLPPETAILGLAIGNFSANTFGALIFGFMVWRRFKQN